MRSYLTRLYKKAPRPARTLMASGYGYYLRSWRYSPETEVYIKEALARESWSSEQWQDWQARELERLLKTATTQVPYYRAYWEERRRKGEDAAWERLENWPVLTKDALRETPEAFLADDARDKKLFKLSTSGTSGKPLTLWRSREAMRRWYALFELRWRNWYGVSRHDRWAILGGQLVTPVAQQTPPFWVWNAGLNQLYMSTMHISPQNVAHYLEALRRYRIRYLWGYASSLYALAHLALEQGLAAPKLEVAISNAEVLTSVQRESIAKAFGCRAVDTYGMAEAVAGASECDYGVMHLWPDAGIVEVLDDETDRVLPAGEVGRLICTGLINHDMPLIRYEVGDRGSLSPDASRCACGRALPRLTAIEGRTIDNIITLDGRRIFWLNPVFYGLPVREAQIVQEERERLEVKVVPTPAYSEGDRAAIRSRLLERVGDMTIDIQEVESIPRSANGKFRAVVNKVDG